MPADLLFVLRFKIQAEGETVPDCHTWTTKTKDGHAFTGRDLKRITNTHTKTQMPVQLMTCSDSLAHQTVCRLYGQLLITKPLDSFCLYLVLSPSWLWVSSGLQKGLFPYLGCHSLHPWRDKGRGRLSVFVAQQTGRSVWVLWLLCCWPWRDEDQGLALVKFRCETHCAFFVLFIFFKVLHKARVDTAKQWNIFRRHRRQLWSGSELFWHLKDTWSFLERY